jgi:hypothetical protein
VFAREMASLAGRVFDRGIRFAHGAEENDHFTIFFAGIFILRHVITSLSFVRHQRVVLSPVRVDAVAWLVRGAESMASCHRDDQRALPTARQRDPCHAARNDLHHAAPNGLRHAVLHDLHCGVDVRHPCAGHGDLRRDVRVFLPCVAGFFPRRDGLRALLLADAQHPGEPCGREPRHGERPYLAPLPCAQRVLAA